MSESLEKEIVSFLEHHPDVKAFDVLIPDMNGVFRGKRVTLEKFKKISNDGMFLPASVFGMDVVGETIEETGLGISSGDSDRHCSLIPGSLKPIPWQPGIGQMMLAMEEKDGSPFYGNPREVLKNLLKKNDLQGFQWKAAFELEFFVIESQKGNDETIKIPDSLNTETSEGQLYSIGSLELCRKWLEEIVENCASMGVPADTSVAELAPGQFEINLHHVNDPLLACDHALNLKQVVKGTLRNHGMKATFMAKPFASLPGSGMHLHLSLYDNQGENLLAPKNSKKLNQAVSGILDLMPESMIFCAPHANSYHRFEENSYAPINATWGKDNRTTALRIPSGNEDSTRIEHRLSGADANPYLVMAMLISGFLHGFEEDPEIPPETIGNGYEDGSRPLPQSWEAALDLFQNKSRLSSILGQEFSTLYTQLKSGEQKRFRRVITPHEYDWYLHTV
ncbi:MAG: glutamine synthetase family protein [Deltaproteobacteria bacterium]